MKKITIIFYTVLIFSSILASCTSTKPTATISPARTSVASPVPIVKEAGEMEWEKIMARAKKEGKVVVYFTGEAEPRRVMVDEFKEKFGINAEFLSAPGGELSAKILTERRAGLYLADVYIGGSSTILANLKPKGILLPLEPALFLPEVLDAKLWFGGYLPFQEKEHLMISFMLMLNAPVGINTEVVKPEEVQSYLDLLNPKWKKKIVMLDPTTPGFGQSWFQKMSDKIMGLDFIKQLAKQELFFTRDKRLQFESLVRGKYPISIAASSSMIGEFGEAARYLKFFIPAEGSWMTTGSWGNIVLINDAPHPNAARLFLNWVLTKEVQSLLIKASGGQYQSAREDVPLELSNPGVRRNRNVRLYGVDNTEEELLRIPEAMKLANEIFGIR